MKTYEQEITITLSHAQAISLRVALGEYLRHTAKALADAGDTSAPQENSCMWNVDQLRRQLDQAALGNKNPETLGSVRWKMVAANQGATVGGVK